MLNGINFETNCKGCVVCSRNNTHTNYPHSSPLPQPIATPPSDRVKLAPPDSDCTTIAPVPCYLAIGANRFYIWVLAGGERWHIPAQFSETEARLLLEMIGEERDRDYIFRIVELAPIYSRGAA